jgi:PleD family two-component response regulator
MDKAQILIIEDDKQIARFFDEMLSLAGHDCGIAVSAKDGLDQLASSVPDLILLDLHLGLEGNDDDILYQVRSNPRYTNTRVVVITPYPTIAEMVTSLADLILIKPVDMKQFQTLAAHIESLEPGPREDHFHDAISELYTKEFLLSRLETAYERGRRRTEFRYAVLVYQFQIEGRSPSQTDPEDLMHLMEEIARRVRRSVRPLDTVARLSGWRFTTLLEELKGPHDVNVVGKRLQELYVDPFRVMGKTYRVSIKMGAAINNPQYPNANSILDAAISALEKSRKGTGDDIWGDPSLAED